MIIVIQCASSKRPDAGKLVSSDGRPVIFVANPDPELVPNESSFVYARPDDQAEKGITWRDLLLLYNEGDSNPLSLYPAYRLYENPTYERLVDRFSLKNVYVLSAGWGLISADFLTPYYDITFSKASKVERYKRRQKADCYQDFCMLPNDSNEHIAFFGGKDYVPLFCALTKSARGERTVFYNSAQPPAAPGCALEHFDTPTRTNWHYECANHFLSKYTF